MTHEHRPSALRQNVISDTDVNHYETMPLEDVREELRRAGIDPDSTIAAVKQLIEESVATDGKSLLRTGS